MYDVVVIGAGPGGGSAALHAARAGLSTLILEADPEIGTPVHCGECLSELAVQNLGLTLPDHVKALDVKGIRVISPTEPISCSPKKAMFSKNICLSAGWRTRPLQRERN